MRRALVVDDEPQSFRRWHKLAMGKRKSLRDVAGAVLLPEVWRWMFFTLVRPVSPERCYACLQVTLDILWRSNVWNREKRLYQSGRASNAYLPIKEKRFAGRNLSAYR